MFKRAIILSFLYATMAYGQSASNSITVTATRASSVPPDQMIFGISVTSPLTATQSDVLSAVQIAGLTAANFSGVNTVQQYSGTGQTTTTSLQWTFALYAPIANQKSILATLAGLQIAIAQQKNGMSVAISVQGTQVSPQAQQAQACPLTDLISDARAQAQKIASAPSMTVGAILAISTSTANGSSVASGSLCSLTVKFALGGF
jgi:hypothetical protein